MNINQQTEIEDLFRRINKNIGKNQKAKIGDDDLNKVRAFVVQSQRPLQAVRLLQKEREERERSEESMINLLEQTCNKLNSVKFAV